METKYDYQKDAIDDAVAFLKVPSHGRRLYAAPTGTGKSYIAMGILNELPECWLITPRVEIAAGIMDKMGVSGPMHEHRIATPIVMRNRLLAGEWKAPTQLIIDEAHHHTAETYQILDLLTGACPTVGLTATPYRGSPKSSAEFRRQWGEPIWVITYPEALVHGVLSMPTCSIVPLVDDDKVRVVNGQFEVESLESETSSRLEDAAALLRPYFNERRWDRPTMVSVPSRKLAKELARLCNDAEMAVAVVDGDTKQSDRQLAFTTCVDRWVALIQIQVVSEGVDLPIRRLLDLHPMVSPVEWLQSFGRITRPVAPGEGPPEYICTNRNLMRHCYLLEGLIPPSIVAAGEKMFGGPSSRLGSRGLGLEALGRFKGSEIPFEGGVTGMAYTVSTCEGASTRQYACIVHPLRAEPLWASRINQRTDDPMKPHYGRWSRCEAPLDLAGFASIPPAPVSEKQSAWWKRSAARHGLDADAKVTRKGFSILPVLSDLRMKL